MIFRLVVLVGVATAYAGPYVGQERFCGGLYELDADPWVALNVSGHGDYWECGKWVLVEFDTGETLYARAMDAGPFDGYYVEQWGKDRPIVMDVPLHLFPVPGISAPAKVYVLP